MQKADKERFNSKKSQKTNTSSRSNSSFGLLDLKEGQTVLSKGTMRSQPTSPVNSTKTEVHHAKSLLLEEVSKLHDTIDQLRNYLSEDNDIKIPKLCVIGMQSAGKSTLL